MPLPGSPVPKQELLHGRVSGCLPRHCANWVIKTIGGLVKATPLELRDLLSSEFRSKNGVGAALAPRAQMSALPTKRKRPAKATRPKNARPVLVAKSSTNPTAASVGDGTTLSGGSSDASFLDDVDDVTTDELGDPLVTSSAREEATGDALETPDAEQESFPLPHHGRVRGEE